MVLSKQHKTPQPLSNKPTWKRVLENTDLYLFCLLGIVITFVFSYLPLVGIQIAFRNFSPKKGFWNSPWVGLQHFQRFFASPNAWLIIKNTLILSLYSMIAGFPIPIALALMLNSFRHKRYRKLIQTVTYAPNFISTVVMCGMLVLFMSPRVGVINTIVKAMGFQPINFMAEQGLWRHIYVWSGVWQGMGFGSVIYFAALSGVSPEYHEAATVDGATKFQKVIYIDLPFILPTATIMLILNAGSIMSVGFDKAFLLQNPLNVGVSEIISTYTYKMGLINNDMSFSTAIGLFNSAVNAVLLIIVNTITSRLSENSLF